MRLSDVLSKPPSPKFVQVENIYGGSLPKIGTAKKVNSGQISINYFCCCCNDTRTFISKEPTYAVLVNQCMISIDCLLVCQSCSSAVVVWFLVESEQDITLPAPKIRIRQRIEQTFRDALLNKPEGKFSTSLELADRAYRDGYGAGAVIYLRKVFEQVIVDMAQLANISTKTLKGKRRKFEDLLTDVNQKVSIVSSQLPKNGYSLFSILSEVIHANYDEVTALEKYPALKRLVISVADNADSYQEISKAFSELGIGEGEHNDKA